MIHSPHFETNTLWAHIEVGRKETNTTMLPLRTRRHPALPSRREEAAHAPISNATFLNTSPSLRKSFVVLERLQVSPTVFPVPTQGWCLHGMRGDRKIHSYGKESFDRTMMFSCQSALSLTDE